MAIIRWNPWNLQSMLEDDWDMPTVPGLSRILGQGLNIYETEKAIVAEVALPGIPEDKVDVSIDDSVVKISASADDSQEEKSTRKYYMSSITKTFNYSFKLPEGITEDKEPEAVLHNGVLTLTFKKTEPIPPKKIKVISGKNNLQKRIETSSENKA